MDLRDNDFSAAAQRIAKQACRIALRRSHRLIDLEHVLLALLELRPPAIRRALDHLNTDTSSIRHDVNVVLDALPKSASQSLTESQVQITSRVAKAIEAANHQALSLFSRRIEPEHIFLGILGAFEQSDQDRHIFIARSLLKQGVNVAAFRAALLRTTSGD